MSALTRFGILQIRNNVLLTLALAFLLPAAFKFMFTNQMVYVNAIIYGLFVAVPVTLITLANALDLNMSWINLLPRTRLKLALNIYGIQLLNLLFVTAAYFVSAWAVLWIFPSEDIQNVLGFEFKGAARESHYDRVTWVLLGVFVLHSLFFAFGFRKGMERSKASRFAALSGDPWRQALRDGLLILAAVGLLAAVGFLVTKRMVQLGTFHFLLFLAFSSAWLWSRAFRNAFGLNQRLYKKILHPSLLLALGAMIGIGMYAWQGTKDIELKRRFEAFQYLGLSRLLTDSELVQLIRTPIRGSELQIHRLYFSRLERLNYKPTPQLNFSFQDALTLAEQGQPLSRVLEYVNAYSLTLADLRRLEDFLESRSSTRELADYLHKFIFVPMTQAETIALAFGKDQYLARFALQRMRFQPSPVYWEALRSRAKALPGGFDREFALTIAVLTGKNLPERELRKGEWKARAYMEIDCGKVNLEALTEATYNRCIRHSGYERRLRLGQAPYIQAQWLVFRYDTLGWQEAPFTEKLLRPFR